jgi:hypothetical protein
MVPKYASLRMDASALVPTVVGIVVITRVDLGYPTPEDTMDNWRHLGDVPRSAFRSEFARLGSPMLDEADAIHEAARPHSALCLAMMWVEQKFATLSSIPTAFHNPLSLARPDGSPADGDDRWERYDSWADGVRAWRERITSTTYKPSNPGVYARTTTLEDLIEVYAPPSENDSGRYVRQVRERLAAVQGETPDPEHEETGESGTGPFAKAKIPAFMIEARQQNLPLPPIAKLGGASLLLVSQRYRAKKETPVLNAASRKTGKPVRRPLAAGEEFDVAYVFASRGEPWGLSVFGSRIPLADAGPVPR